MFGFFLLFVSTGLTVCYSYRLFYFVLCGDFNFVPSYSMVETSYNMVFGIIGFLIMSIFGGGSLMWFICQNKKCIGLHRHAGWEHLLDTGHLGRPRRA